MPIAPAKQQGVVLILFVALLPIIISMAFLAIDYSHLSLIKSNLKIIAKDNTFKENINDYGSLTNSHLIDINSLTIQQQENQIVLEYKAKLLIKEKTIYIHKNI